MVKLINYSEITMLSVGKVLSAVNFHGSKHKMVICRENFWKINRPIIRPNCCKFASKQSTVK